MSGSDAAASTSASGGVCDPGHGFPGSVDAGTPGGDGFAVMPSICPAALSLAACPGLAGSVVGIAPVLLAIQCSATIADRRVLRSRGCPGALPSLAWVAFPGAYLQRRARALGQSDGLVWVWMASMLHPLVLLAIAAAKVQPSIGTPPLRGRCIDLVTVDSQNEFGGHVPLQRCMQSHHGTAEAYARRPTPDPGGPG